jgi:hypothetical protein
LGKGGEANHRKIRNPSHGSVSVKRRKPFCSSESG